MPLFSGIRIPDRPDLVIDGIYNTDCIEGLVHLKDDVVDMVLCDLPYGLTANKWDCEISLERLWPQLWRVLKSNGVICLTASQPFTSTLVSSQRIYFKHEWIWIKNRGGNFLNVKREPMKEHESVLVFSRGKWTYNAQLQLRNGGGATMVGKQVSHGNSPTTNYGKKHGLGRIKLSEFRVPSSLQKFNTQVKPLHPTQKPVPLFEYFIRTYTNEGELVLDCCMGSGTTAIAALNTNRHFIGFEADPVYYQRSLDRIVRESGI